MNKVDEALNNLYNLHIEDVQKDYHIQLAQVFEQRIKELEEDNKELTNYYDKNKDYEQQYNVCINLMEEIRVNMWSEIHHRNIAEYKLNAIREVIEKRYKDKNIHIFDYNKIISILEESK